MPDTYNPFHLCNLYNAELGEGNLGGLAAVWYTPVSNFRSWPWVGPLVVKALDLVEGAVWYQLVSTRGTLSYDGAPKAVSRQGDVINHKIKGALPRHAKALAIGLEPMPGQRYVALYRDLNGEVQLIGTPDQPLEFSATYTAGSETKRNGYDWTLQGDTVRPARPYVGTWLVSEKGLEYALENASGVVIIRDADGGLIGEYPPGTTVILPSDDHEELDGLQGGKLNEHYHLTKAMYDKLNAVPFVEPTFNLSIVGTPAPRSTGYYKRGVDMVTSMRVQLTATRNSAGAVVSSLVSIPPSATQNFTGLMAPNPKDFVSALVVSTTVGASATFGPGGGRTSNTTLSAVAYLSFAYSFYYGATVTGPVDLASLSEEVRPFGNNRAITFALQKGQRSVLFVPGDQFFTAITDQNNFPCLDNWTQTRVQLTQGRDSNVPYIQLLENDTAAVDNTATFTFTL